MKARKWSVGELIELTPFEASILGYNRNAGQLIALRLRTDDLSGFRHYDSIRKVLLHELTHNVSLQVICIRFKSANSIFFFLGVG